MGKTGARLKELERKNEILFNIVCREIVSNSDLRQILDGHNSMLKELIEERDDAVKIKARLGNTEDALVKAISENFSMAQAIRKLQDLDADRVKIINFLYDRINSLEAKPIGLWAKLKSFVFGRK